MALNRSAEQIKSIQNNVSQRFMQITDPKIKDVALISNFQNIKHILDTLVLAYDEIKVYNLLCILIRDRLGLLLHHEKEYYRSDLLSSKSIFSTNYNDIKAKLFDGKRIFLSENYIKEVINIFSPKIVQKELRIDENQFYHLLIHLYGLQPSHSPRRGIIEFFTFLYHCTQDYNHKTSLEKNINIIWKSIIEIEMGKLRNQPFNWVMPAFNVPISRIEEIPPHMRSYGMNSAGQTTRQRMPFIASYAPAHTATAAPCEFQATGVANFPLVPTTFSTPPAISPMLNPAANSVSETEASSTEMRQLMFDLAEGNPVMQEMLADVFNLRTKPPGR